MLTKERFAWVWVGALVAVLGAYAGVVAIQTQGGEPSPGVRIGTLAVALSILGLVALGTWLAGRRRADPLDERDLIIEGRSAAMAYNVLMAGMILVGCVMPFGAGGWKIVHAALCAIALAEIVHHGLIILGYRRGWRV
ncbi:hypothetical protein KR767_03260 [Luteibacter anthropi]|uniref:hypothetical protein n=1 Tax=Luteibacter anthropi TaxID=564369 RepID=UPI0020328999|nr:hypothetical protein [Luteibacter anthropi]URX63102.1 hypothetical protein KR767_03260 [Luteibacter anthropi]